MDVKVENLDFKRQFLLKLNCIKIGITENALCKVCNEKNEGILHIYIM